MARHSLQVGRIYAPSPSRQPPRPQRCNITQCLGPLLLAERVGLAISRFRECGSLCPTARGGWRNFARPENRRDIEGRSTNNVLVIHAAALSALHRYNQRYLPSNRTRTVRNHSAEGGRAHHRCRPPGRVFRSSAPHPIPQSPHRTNPDQNHSGGEPVVVFIQDRVPSLNLSCSKAAQ